MREEKQIERILKKRIRRMEKKELEGISSINNLVALKRCGIYHVDVEFDDGSSAELLLKIKSNNVLKNGINLVSGKDFRLMKELVLHKKVLGYDKSYLREDVLYREIDSSLKNAMIDYYGCYDDRRSGTKNLLFKYYAWNEQGLDAKALRAVLDRILPFHVFYMGRDEDAGKLQLNKYSSRDYFKARPCLHMMFDLREGENNRTYGSDRIRALHEFIDRIHEEEARYDAFKTFTHNDFSSRNFFVRGEEVLFYDFELACYQIPEHDVAELLVYECGAITDEEIRELLHWYYCRLRDGSPYDLTEQEYHERLLFCIREFIVNRLSLLRIVSESIQIDFIEQLLINTSRLLDLFQKKESEGGLL